MAEVQVNGNTIDTTEAEHTYKDASSSEFIYVNSHGDLTNDQKQELFNLGVEIQEYISDHTYMCHYRKSDLEVIRKMPFVRTVNVYEPSMKTDASLKRDIASASGQTDYKLEVQVHPDAPQTLDQVAEEISRRTGIAVDAMTVSGGRVELTVHRDNIEAIEKIDSVNHIEEFRPVAPHNEYARGLLAQNWDYTSFGWPNEYVQYKGKGEIVVIADSGIDRTHRAFKDKIHRYYNLRDSGISDVSGHGTHVAGSVVEGVATEAKIIPLSMWGYNDQGQGSLYTSSDPYYMFESPYTEYGARIHTNSWGHSWTNADPDRGIVGQTEQAGYDANATTMDTVAYRNSDYVLVVSAGNDGGRNNWKGELAGQNGAKNVIVVGNCLSLRPNDGDKYDSNCTSPDAKRMGRYSSTGPTKVEATMDPNLPGRIKPDVVAPGTAILSALSSQKPAAEVEENARWNGGKYWHKDYCYLSGTSMSTPHVAGCCAVIREALRAKDGPYMKRPSAALVKAILINGTIDLKGHYAGDGETLIEPAPNGVQGFGRVDLSNSLLNIVEANTLVHGNSRRGTSGFGFVDAGDDNPSYWPRSISVGTSWKNEYYDINCKQKVFCATLVYPDEAGKRTQNTLNLIVRSGGEERYGNMGTGTGSDQVNNVEKVVWENPPDPKIEIEVKATAFTKGYQIKQSFACAWMSHNNH